MWRESKEWPLRLSSNIPKLKMVRISINLNTTVEGIARSGVAPFRSWFDTSPRTKNQVLRIAFNRSP
jgi:hypothetical protein